MKTVFLVGLMMAACAPVGRPQEEKPVQTHPVRNYRPSRMVAMNTVAVIDTGLTISENTKNAKLCATGHKNFTGNPEMVNARGILDPVPVDNHGHGTNIAGLIQAYAGESGDYCLVILKYFDPKFPDQNNLKNTINAIEYATKIKAKYINYSGGGEQTTAEERKAVKAFLDSGGTFVAAAGNERSDLAKHPYYPAMDDVRVIVVGSKEVNGKIANYSNYGVRVNFWEFGSKRTGFGITQSGTSQATAIITGKIIRFNNK